MFYVVLYCEFGPYSPESCSSLFCTMLRAGLTDTNVKSAVTSYDVRHSPGPSVMFFICSVKSCVFCIWSWDLPISG